MKLKLPCLLGCLALLLAAPSTWAQQEGVAVGKTSKFAKLVPAQEIEDSAAQQYNALLQEAAKKNALVSEQDPQVQRLRRIAQRIIPYSEGWNDRAKGWSWQVNLIQSKQINAFCMPGGKIVFYTGILDQLALTDNEIAQVMGHEVAHALREHARERIGKGTATTLGANLVSQIFGLGDLGRTVAGYSAELLNLKFGREDESEADLVGLELAARAGYDPRAGVSLWKKMAAQNKSAPPQWLSTHPAGTSRIAEIERNLPKVMPLYQKASKPPKG